MMFSINNVGWHRLPTTTTVRDVWRWAHIPLSKPVINLLLVNVFLSANLSAQEIAPFRITSVDGYLQARGVRDDYGTSQGGGATTSSKQTDARAELFIMTHSVVYHPNLLTLDIGGGPVFQHMQTDTETGTTKGDVTLYNLTARATILRDKPFRGAIFYEHLNPTLNVAPGQVMNQQNSRYGFDFSLLNPITPVPIYVDFSRAHNEGRSVDRVVNDHLERLNVKATRALGDAGTTRLQFQNLRQESVSGSPNLPIQGTESKSQAINSDTNIQFGDKRQYNLTNYVTYNTQNFTLNQGAIPDRRDVRFMLDLRARHSEQWNTFALYNYNASVQGDVSSTAHTASAGVNYWRGQHFSASVGAHGEDNKTTQLNLKTVGLDASMHLQRELDFGLVQLNYAVRADQRDQSATAPTTNVLGERLNLAGLGWLTLGHQHIAVGTVVVSDVARTQKFIEGRDYIINVVGNETRLQRVAGGNLLDGQDVLVDYVYDVGGTFAYRQADHNAHLTYSLGRYATLTARYMQAVPQLLSGMPAYTLNHVKSTLLGLRADYPLKNEWNMVIGGNIEAEDRRETVLSSKRLTYDAYLQSDDPWSKGSFRLSARKTKQNFDNADLNIDLTGVDFRYWSRLPYGIDVSADVAWEKDVGGLQARERLAATAKAYWRYRLLNLSLNFGLTHESQATYTRNRKNFQFLLRRDL